MPTNDHHEELRILKAADVHKLFTVRIIYQHQTFKLPINFLKNISKLGTKFTTETPEITGNSISGYNSIKVVGAKIFNQVPEDLKNVQAKKKQTKKNKLKQLVKIYLLSKY